MVRVYSAERRKVYVSLLIIKNLNKQNKKSHNIDFFKLNDTIQMSILLFSLRGVSDDEAEEVRDLLTTNKLNFYETSAGNWGVSMPAIWLINNEDLSKAKKLLMDYQRQRMLNQRERANETLSFFSSIKENPLRFIICIGAIFFVLYLSIRVIFELGFKF